jgi:hypothetical protein
MERIVSNQDGHTNQAEGDGSKRADRHAALCIELATQAAQAAKDQLEAAEAAYEKAREYKDEADIRLFKAKLAQRKAESVIVALEEWSSGRLLAAVTDGQPTWRWLREPEHWKKRALELDLNESWKPVRQAMTLRHRKVSAEVTYNDVQKAARDMVTPYELIAFMEAETWREANKIAQRIASMASASDGLDSDTPPRWSGLKQEWQRYRHYRRA